MVGSPNQTEVRRSLTEENVDMDRCMLADICYGEEHDDEFKRLSTLKHLRELNLLQKEDITETQLLRQSCRVGEDDNDEGLFLPSGYPANESIFHYLVEWDPTALKTLDTRPIVDGEYTLLQEVMDVLKKYISGIVVDDSSID